MNERPRWARSWPAMVVLAVSAIVWSKEVEEAIKGVGTAGGSCAERMCVCMCACVCVLCVRMI